MLSLWLKGCIIDNNLLSSVNYYKEHLSMKSDYESDTESEEEKHKSVI